MSEPGTPPIDADELRLAQLACSRLARLVQGALSIGLPALGSGVPEPRAFLGDQFRIMGAFGLVLHSISGKPGCTREILRLRERSAAVLAALERLQRQLLAYLEPADRTPLTLRAARESASALCDAIAEYGDLVRLDGSPIVKVRSVVMQIFQEVENSETLRESTPR